MIPLRPLDDRVVVVPLDGEQEIGGIIIPDVAMERPSRGTVLAVGPGSLHAQTGERVPVSVEEGDVVVYSRFGGTEVTVEGEDYLVLRESDLLAVVVEA